MGLLDGLLGGVIGAGMVTVVNGLIQKHGGLQGMVQEFEQKGLGDTIKSWVGMGENAPISTDQVQHVLGRETLTDLATKVGISPQDLAAKLATVLPQAIDKLTPDGVVPKA